MGFGLYPTISNNSRRFPELGWPIFQPDLPIVKLASSFRTIDAFFATARRRQGLDGFHGSVSLRPHA
jgi:hypothetical protein